MTNPPIPAKSRTPRRRLPKSGRRDAQAGLALFRTMLKIRRSEEALSTLFANGEIPGFLHLSVGQEAVAAGIMSVLGDTDTIASTHRGHGHSIAKGMKLDAFFAEIFGREDGLCKGRGGSMHVADMSLGMLGANGIVAAGVPICLGSALAHRIGGSGAISAAFFGDGAMAEGVVHESLNLAKLWMLPVLFVCENNGWAEFRPTSKQVTFRLEDLAAAFGLPYRRVDGNDVFAVAEAAAGIAALCRSGQPAVLECMTSRVRGHFEGDPQKYRTEGDVAANGDPLAVAERTLRELGVGDEALARVRTEVEREIADATEFARNSPQPALATALASVYAAEAA